MFIDFSATNKIDNLTCVIIHDNLTCVDYPETHYSILLYFCGAIGLLFYIINRTIHGVFGNMKLLLVLNRISHSFALLTLEIPWSTLEINFIFPDIHALFFEQIKKNSKILSNN